MIINYNLNKELKSVEHQALKQNDKLSLKPKFGPNKIKYEHTLSQLKLVKISCKEIKNLSFNNIICILVGEMF